MSGDGVPTVQAAVIAVKRELGAVGKDRRVTEGPAKYAYRGIDAMLDALHPALCDAGLVIVPAQAVPRYEMRQTRNGAASQWLTLCVDWLVMGPAGDTLTVEVPEVNALTGEVVMVRRCPQTIGEASDTSDKATNKAHTAAWKVLLSELFAVPYTADVDPDEERPDAGVPVPEWSEDQRTLERALQDRLDNLPADLYDKAVVRATEHAAKAGKVWPPGVRFDGVGDLGPPWLEAWRKMLDAAWEAAETRKRSDAPGSPETPETVPVAADPAETAVRPVPAESEADPVAVVSVSPPDFVEPVASETFPAGAPSSWAEVEALKPSAVVVLLGELGASRNGSPRVVRERLAKKLGIEAPE